MPEVDVPALLDIGTKVSTITKDFFNRHFRSKGHKKLLLTSGWLSLTVENGLKYLTLDTLS